MGLIADAVAAHRAPNLALTVLYVALTVLYVAVTVLYLASTVLYMALTVLYMVLTVLYVERTRGARRRCCRHTQKTANSK